MVLRTNGNLDNLYSEASLAHLQTVLDAEIARYTGEAQQARRLKTMVSSFAQRITCVITLGVNLILKHSVNALLNRSTAFTSSACF